ncbi:hypothetical protein B7494_g3125 [Chlorociboria aeruginascens]|nr:hypothetical protein B7494_g3125 [Chlorociboria aeruginascens]
MLLSLRPLWSTHKAFDSAACLVCQWQSFSTAHPRYASKETPKNDDTKPPAPAPRASALDAAPRAYGKRVKEFTPQALDRPLGLATPPRAGDNSGVDGRTLRQRRDDFVSWEKHLSRRKQLTQKMSTPYFREWSNMDHHKGKSFLAPRKLFKAEHALYFTNFQGQTLVKRSGLQDTTPVLQDKVSIVSVFSSQWAEDQTSSFVSENINAELHEVVKESEGSAQIVKINVEDNTIKAWLVKLFMGSARRRIAESEWGRNFLVKRHLEDEKREAMGFLNTKSSIFDGEDEVDILVFLKLEPVVEAGPSQYPLNQRFFEVTRAAPSTDHVRVCDSKTLPADSLDASNSSNHNDHFDDPAPHGKLSQCHDLRKSIAKVLTIINANQRSQLRLFYKNKKYLPLDLRPKQTRAIRRRLSKHESGKVLEKTKKRSTHFPQRKFAIKAEA